MSSAGAGLTIEARIRGDSGILRSVRATTSLLFATLMISACGEREPAGQGGSGVLSTTSSAGTGGSGTGTSSATGTGGSGTGGVGTGGSGTGGTMAAMAPTFGTPITLSDPANNSFVPTIAARAGQCLVAWHDFVSGQARVVYSLIVDGVPGPMMIVPETFTGGKNPWLAATTNGYVLTYQANDGQTDVARAVEIDALGAVVQGPDTISMPGTSAAMVRVAASGDQEAFAWTDGSTHSFALRGAETVPPTAVGTTLVATGLLNFPRIALDATGNLFLAYRDGGVDTTTWDVLLVMRPPQGTFGTPKNVSKSAGLLSDDVSVAVEANGTLDIAWVDQDGVDLNSFEVAYATRAPDGTVTKPKRYGTQGLWTWTPSVVPGLAAAWRAGTGNSGPLYFATPDLAPTPILTGEAAARVVMAEGPDARYHVAYYTGGPGSLVRYARSE